MKSNAKTDEFHDFRESEEEMLLVASAHKDAETESKRMPQLCHLKTQLRQINLLQRMDE
jgi:hypothetical protein